MKPVKAGEYRFENTAEGVTTIRAAAALSEDEKVRNPDYLAIEFLDPKDINYPHDIEHAQRFEQQIEQFMPKCFQYINVRTMHMDALLLDALGGSLSQYVLLGAGFDSRPYRFKDKLKDVSVFELDLPKQQNPKKAKLKKIFGSLPDHVKFVSIDFISQNLEKVLALSGYDKNAKTYFSLEGVSPYMTEGAVNKTLAFIHDYSAEGSSIAFDYTISSIIEGRCDEDALKTTQYLAESGQPWKFGIDDGLLSEFLRGRGFKVISNYGARELEGTYLIKSDGNLLGNVSSCLRIVHAETRD